MFKKLKRFLIGKPLKSNELEGEKFGVLWGLPILASDAISSVAYAGHEILLVLILSTGMLAFQQISYYSLAIIILLAILTLSYRQTIDSYPNGGGAYIVAKENTGIITGVIAGAALSIGYILTVAVSIASGVDQIVSAFRSLEPYRVHLCVIIICLMTLINLRGIKESARVFSLPTYAFIVAVIGMIIVGMIKIFNGYKPEPLILSVETTAGPLTLFLIMKAFTNGCAALTGVEAVSNSVPNFKTPSSHYAKSVLVILSTLVLIVFGGTSMLAYFYPVDPFKGAMLVQMAALIFGEGLAYYIITALTFLILVLAANTAYFGFPNLISVMSTEGYAPRQLAMRGDRLSYSNGIIALSGISIVLIILFKAKVTSLIGLYAIGVFISFTLSQSGMFMKWYRERNKGWVLKASINGFGALVTASVVLMVAVTKFTEGAWLVVVIVPIIISVMLKINRHYTAVAKQLMITDDEFEKIDMNVSIYRNRVIVPIDSVNKSSIRALRYAKTISDNVTAFSVTIDEQRAKKLVNDFGRVHLDIPIVVKHSPFRKVVEPLLKYIESVEYNYKKGDMITVILPQFMVKRWWHSILHNNTRYFIERELLKHKHIVVSTIPLQLKEDDLVLDLNKTSNKKR